MHSRDIRKQVIELITQGKTYSEIQHLVKHEIPKSTISGWVKNLPVPVEYYEKLRTANLSNLKKARMIAIKNIAIKRKAYLMEVSLRNKDVLDKLDVPTQKLILSILYLGEGAKNSNGSQFLGLASSNPKIIKLYIKLLNNCYQTLKEKFRVRVQIRADQDIDETQSYWKEVTGISEGQFYPTYIDLRTKNTKTKKVNYMGVCSIYYFNTDIQLELESLAQNVINSLT